MHQRNRGLGRAAFITGTLILAGAVAAAMVLMRDRYPVSAVMDDGTATAASRMLSDIRQYREDSKTLAPEQAVTQWFALYERANSLGEDDRDPDAFDDILVGMVNEESLLAALPPPSAWPAFRAAAVRRTDEAAAPTDMLTIRYLAEILDGDRDAAFATLDRLETKHNTEYVRHARLSLARLYGDAAAQVTAFESDLARQAAEYEDLEVPDLRALAGERRAEELLRRAMSSHRVVRVTAGDAMQRVTRRVALANVERMTRPQWALVNSVEAADLYEAMTRRFKPGDRATEARAFDWYRREATTYYFLRMVQLGRQAEAERALDELSAGGNLQIPRAAVMALQRAQLNEPLYRFLDGLLQRRPELGAWELYLEQAAYTGHAQEVLARLEALLARPDLAAALRAQLQMRRFSALLAADRIDAAEELALELLAAPPRVDDADRVAAAARALRLGRLLDNPKLIEAALQFLRAAMALPSQDGESAVTHTVQHTLYRELRLLGRAEEALALARANDQKKPETFAEAFARRMGHEFGAGQGAVVEMAGIHSAAGRHEEVLALLKTSPRWGAPDLAQLLSVEDSQGVPAGVIVARALAAKGDQASALRVARAVVAAMPGRDAGYELIAALDSNAIATFDALYAADPYEERPLIWKASLQLIDAPEEAEATIRRAIAIDPSDGEEGRNDRMRAYAVLAEVLRKQGDSSDARLYANAVQAIRISEHADELHEAGLFERAFRAYREALEKFSDAYCIQSRLAVQLNKQGRRREALEHYRRAYELMPSSFGRVESHCFGCESVFVGAESQSLAERVFTEIIRKSPDKPQAHYLLAYLREEQGRHEDALQPLRAAVSLDAQYLNAWKRLNDLADKTFIESGERDIARLKLIELDPLQRHGRYDLTEVADLRALWAGAERAKALHGRHAPPAHGLYRLDASAALREAADEDLPAAMRVLERAAETHGAARGPAATMFEHVLVAGARALLQTTPESYSR
jgi:tetratricopeptide (TPR) repeat protein